MNMSKKKETKMKVKVNVEDVTTKETSGTWKIKEGSYYHVKTDNWDSGGMEDDYFKDFVFPYSVISHIKSEYMKQQFSLIYLMSGVLITDRENLVRIQ